MHLVIPGLGNISVPSLQYPETGRSQCIVFIDVLDPVLFWTCSTLRRVVLNASVDRFFFMRPPVSCSTLRRVVLNASAAYEFSILE
jgi:hypothetical protein